MSSSLGLDKQIVNEFQEEANTLLQDLKLVIEKLEEDHQEFPRELLEEFGNKTDRVMGAAKTFSGMYPDEVVFAHIGKFSELCKATSYKASTLNHLGLIPIFAAFWADTLDILQDCVDNVGNSKEKIEGITQGYVPVLQKRLVWLAQQIVSKTKGSQNSEQAKINVDGLLKKMGIEV